MIQKHDFDSTKAGWRQIAGILDTQIKPVVVIGFIELFVKICLDYLHELVRDKIPFGRMKSEEYFV